jgi:adenylosuccinate synthase
MARHAQAVIGANWGDEGKGLAVDAISSVMSQGHDDVVVVRSNGGAQAGHGVERPEGGRHIFHHVGAGSFVGAATHLSRFFVAHPMMLEAELSDLSELGVRPRAITIDPRAPVTTPWDMAINQAVELARGDVRHGSTGLGFGETIERQEKGPMLVAADLWDPRLPGRLEEIRDTWIERRLIALDIDPEDSQLSDVLTGRIDLISRFIEDCRRFRARVDLRDDGDLGSAQSILFEGAQGLQLDMDFGVFPHVTRSHTGLKNMLAISAEAGIQSITPTYMSRAYATRHGAGPLPHEIPGFDGVGRIDWADIVDLTNASNAWQGTIREAPLDADLLGATIARDLALATNSGIEINPGLGITCLDQIRGKAVLMKNQSAAHLGVDALAHAVSETTNLPINLISRGPTRRTAQMFSI